MGILTTMWLMDLVLLTEARVDGMSRESTLILHVWAETLLVVLFTVRVKFCRQLPIIFVSCTKHQSP
jgi:hypothetical protein